MAEEFDFEIEELGIPAEAEEETAIAVAPQPEPSAADAALDEFEIEEIPRQPEEEKGFFSTAVDETLGALETGLAVVAPIVGEAVAGVGGIAKTITSGPEEGEKTITQIKEAFSFEPSLEETKRNLKAAGNLLKPVGEALQKARDFLGDNVFEATGSPGLATAAFIIPDAVLEILGARGVSTLSRTGKVQRNAGKLRKVIKRMEAENAAKMDKGVFPAAPSVDEIFDSAGIIYKEVDKFGATVKPEAFSRMADNLSELRGKLDPTLNPEASRLLDIVEEARNSGKQLTASQVDNIRKKAGTVLEKGQGNVDSLVANRVRNEIDNLLGESSSLNVPAGLDPAQISNRLKAARKLYSRGFRSEAIGKALEVANLADNPVNSLKAQFRSLIDPRKKTAKMFNAAETKAIRDYIKPGAGITTLRLIGTLGFDLTNPRSIGNILLGAGGAGAAASGFGVMAGPIMALGTGSEWLAKRLLDKRGILADQMIRAGRDAKELTSLYLKVAKGKNRSAADMGKLLLGASPESVAKLPKTEFMRKALEEMAKAKASIKSRAVAEVVSKKRAGEAAIPAPALGLGTENNEQ
jgi:hypothetical protein